MVMSTRLLTDGTQDKERQLESTCLGGTNLWIYQLASCVSFLWSAKINSMANIGFPFPLFS